MTAQIQYYYIGGLLLGILYSVDCPMSQHMSRHQNTTKNIQQTTHVMTLNATYDIGQFDIIEFKILKKISNDVCCINVSIMSRHMSCFLLYVVCRVFLSFWKV